MNSTRGIAIGSVIGMALGLVLGFVVWGESTEIPDHNPKQAPFALVDRSTSVPTSPTSAVPIPPQPDPEVPAPSTPIRSESPSGDVDAPIVEDSDAMLRRAIELAPKAERPSGDGTIRGKATFRGETTPAAGVIVLATAYPLSSENVETDYAKPAIRNASPGPQWKRSPPGSDAFWRLHYALRNEMYEMSRTYRTVTAADGTYELTGLPGSDGQWTYGFQLYSPEGEAKLERDNTQPGVSLHIRDIKVGDTVDILVSREYEIAFEILMPDGTPAEGAWAYTSGPREGHGGTSGSQWWTERPARTLVAGEYTIWAEMDQLAGLPGRGDRFRMRSNYAEITVGPGGTQSTPVLQLRANPGVRVVVRDPIKITRYFDVKVIHLQNGRIPESVDAQLGNSTSPINVGNGTYVADLPGVKEGSYAAAIIEDGIIIASEIFSFAGEVKIVELTLPPPARDSYVVAWIYGPNGKLLDDLSIQVSIEFDWRGEGFTSFGSFSDAESWRREDGAWCAMHASYNRKGAAKSRGRLRASSSEYGAKMTTYEYSTESECTIRFEAPGSIRVALKNVKGHSHVATLSVLVESTDENQGGQEIHRSLKWYDTIPDTMMLEGVPTGTYWVSLRCDTGDIASGGGTHILDSMQVTVKGDVADATLTAPALHNLTITIPTISANHSLNIRLLEGPNGTSVSASRRFDEKRLVEVKGLVEGTYLISASDQRDDTEYPSVVIQVPSPGPVVFDPKAYDAIAIESLTAETHMYRAGFREGDIVIGQVGSETRNVPALRELLQGDADVVSPIQIAILRQGKPLTISILRSDLASDASGYSVGLHACHR